MCARSCPVFAHFVTEKHYDAKNIGTFRPWSHFVSADEKICAVCGKVLLLWHESFRLLAPAWAGTSTRKHNLNRITNEKTILILAGSAAAVRRPGACRAGQPRARQAAPTRRHRRHRPSAWRRVPQLPHHSRRLHPAPGRRRGVALRRALCRRLPRARRGRRTRRRLPHRGRPRPRSSSALSALSSRLPAPHADSTTTRSSRASCCWCSTRTAPSPSPTTSP